MPMQDNAAATKETEYRHPDSFGALSKAKTECAARNKAMSTECKPSIVFAFNTYRKFTHAKTTKAIAEGRDRTLVVRDRKNVINYYVATEDAMLRYAHQQLISKPSKPVSLCEYITPDAAVCLLFDIENEKGFFIPSEVDINKLRQLFIDVLIQATWDVLGASKIGKGESGPKVNKFHIDDCTRTAKDGFHKFSLHLYLHSGHYVATSHTVQWKEEEMEECGLVLVGAVCKAAYKQMEFGLIAELLGCTVEAAREGLPDTTIYNKGRAMRLAFMSKAKLDRTSKKRDDRWVHGKPMWPAEITPNKYTVVRRIPKDYNKFKKIVQEHSGTLGVTPPKNTTFSQFSAHQLAIVEKPSKHACVKEDADVDDKPFGCEQSVYHVNSRLNKPWFWVSHDAGYGYPSHAVQYESSEGFYKSLEDSKSPRYHTFFDDNKCTLVFVLDWPCCPDFKPVGTDATTLQKCMFATAMFLHTEYEISFTAQVLILSACGLTKNKDGKDTKLHKRSYYLVYPE